MGDRRLVVSFLLAFGLLSVAALAQQATPPPQFPSDTRPGRVVIDGSRNPERIPDRVAIGMFMSSIAIPPSTDKRTLRSMYAKVASLKLTPSDMGILRTELAKLHVRLVAYRETMAAASENVQRLRTPQAAATFTAVAEARDTLAMDSYERVLNVLSPVGAASLRAHISTVKRQMKGLGPGR